MPSPESAFSAPSARKNTAGVPLAALPLYATSLTDTFGGAAQGVVPAALLLRGALFVAFLVWALQGSGVRADFRRLMTASLLYFCTFFFLHYLVDFNAAAVSLEVSATLRVLYGPLLASYIAACLATGRLSAEDARRVILAYGWLILLSLALGHITGLGGAIGGRGVEAGKGFMIGANEVGLMLLLTCPVVVADLKRRLRWTALVAIVALPLYGWAAVYVFTKSSLLVPIVCALALFSLCKRSGGWSLRVAYALLAAVGAFGVSAVLSELDMILAFAQSTFFRALFDDGVIVFLFRGRQDYIEAIYPTLSGHEFSALFWLFGAGEFHVRAISEAPLMLARGEGTTFEMDIFDLLACYGIVGTGLYALLLRRAMAAIPRAQLDSPALVAIAGVLIHGFMAGHVVFSPQVMTVLILLVAASAAPILHDPLFMPPWLHTGASSPLNGPRS